MTNLFTCWNSFDIMLNNKVEVIKTMKFINIDDYTYDSVGNYHTLSHVVKELCKRKSISLTQLELELNNNSLSKILYMNTIKLRTLNLIANYFNVDLIDLYEIKKNTPKRHVQYYNKEKS